MKIRVDGTEYELLLPDEMQLGVQRKFQKIAGVGPDRIATLVEEYNPNILVAWMAVSMWNENRGTPISQIETRLDDLTPAELESIWSDLGEQSPPVAAETKPESGDSEKTSGGDSKPASVSTRVKLIPKDSGAPASDTGSASDPETLAG